MKHTFNNVEFNIAGAQWYITPEVSSGSADTQSTNWIVGLRYIKESGTTGTEIRICEDQDVAERILGENIRALRLIRESRATVVHRIFNSLRIFDAAERKKYFKYVDYWLDRALSPEMIVLRFVKDKKWKMPPAVPERQDRSRHPYYRGSTTASAATYLDTTAATYLDPALQLERQRNSERLEEFNAAQWQPIPQPEPELTIARPPWGQAVETTPPDSSEGVGGLLDWLDEE